MRVAICIGTFHRPALLKELLGSLSQLTFRRSRRPALEAIVVDNDPLGSAREVCQRDDLGIGVNYVIEPKRGIANVRNRAVREAVAADFIAFIDDDETASPEWLDELLWTQARFDADLVAGPVHASFLADVPKWVRESGCFNRSEYSTGTQVAQCCGGNVLISAAVFARIPGFDERFQLTGAEDTQFFLRAHRAGFRMVWSQEATVRESITRLRGNLRWILHRGYQAGNSWVLCETSLRDGLQVRAMRFCKATAHVLVGLMGFVIALPLGRRRAVKQLRWAFLGFGMLAGLFGQRYSAYGSRNNNTAEAPIC